MAKLIPVSQEGSKTKAMRSFKIDSRIKTLIKQRLVLGVSLFLSLAGNGYLTWLLLK